MATTIREVLIVPLALAEGYQWRYWRGIRYAGAGSVTKSCFGGMASAGDCVAVAAIVSGGGSVAVVGRELALRGRR